MAVTTWKQIVYDCANAYRTASGTENLVSIGELPKKISMLKTAGIQLPSLSIKQKNEMRTLMDQYFAKKDLFVYNGGARRESYANPRSISKPSGESTTGCMYQDKYLTNCGVFAQMVWMGRDISDYTPTPTTTLTKAFDWGYYFDFMPCRRAWGVTMANGNKYNYNTYIGKDGSKYFLTLDGASYMAAELYAKGYEIPYSEVEVGDLVFYRGSSISDGEDDDLEQSAFRYISHVAVVYDINEYGPVMMESATAYVAAIGKAGMGDTFSTFQNVYTAGRERKIVMCARHPAAYGEAGNVPNRFTAYRGVDAV